MLIGSHAVRRCGDSETSSATNGRRDDEDLRERRQHRSEEGCVARAGGNKESKSAGAFTRSRAHRQESGVAQASGAHAGERGEAAVDDLLKLFDTEQAPEVRRAALQSLSEIKSTRVEDKLFEIARGNETRRNAAPRDSYAWASASASGVLSS